jgi:chemotaxis signal transduction protein
VTGGRASELRKGPHCLQIRVGQVLPMEWLAFKAGDEYLGIEAQYIHRVVDDVKVTPVPLAPDCHRGLMYYRGEVFDVIHIGSLLRQRGAVYPPASPEPASGGRWRAGLENPRIILIKWSTRKLALVPDHIIGLIWIDESKREQTPHAQREYTVRLISPEHIWEKVSELSYGPRKV